MTILQVILIALILVIILTTAGFVLMGRESARKKRTLSVIRGRSGADLRANTVSRADAQNVRRAEIARKLKESKEVVDKTGKKKTTIAMAIAQAGLNISQKQFWIFSIVSMIVCTLLAKIMGQPPLVLLLVAVTGLLGLPKLFLKMKAGKRQKKFLEEFPDALEATVRLLKAGMPVSEAISMIAKEFTGPVGEEMSIIYDKQKIGVALPEAALEATKRMPLPEMQMFATGLAIQAQTGSSLSEVLMNLSGVIRARFKLKRKVKALSSEAIASASIIGALPNLVALGMYFANREYIMLLFENKTGNILLGAAVMWMLIGIFVMRQMINFRV